MNQLSNSNAVFKNFPGDNTLNLHVRGEERLFSFSENVPKLSYSNAEFKHFPGDNIPDPRFRERKICFCSPKMHHNSPTAMQNSKIFRGTISRTFVLGRGGKFFSFSENVPKLSYSEAEFKKIPGDNIFQTPVLGERKVCFCSPKCTKTLL